MWVEAPQRVDTGAKAAMLIIPKVAPHGTVDAKRNSEPGQQVFSFIVDMNAPPYLLQQTKNVLWELANSGTASGCVNVLINSSEPFPLFCESRALNEGSVSMGVELLDNLSKVLTSACQECMAGASFTSCLEYAWRTSSKQASHTVVYVGSGLLRDMIDGSAIALVSSLRKRSRASNLCVSVSCLGPSENECNKHTLLSLACSTGGNCRFVSQGEDARGFANALIERRVAWMQVDWSLEQNSFSRAYANSSVLQSPKFISAIPMDSVSPIYGFAKDLSFTAVSVECIADGMAVNTVLGSSSSCQLDRGILHRLAVLRLLEDHRKSLWHFDEATDRVAKREAIPMLQKLAIEYQLISDFTSMVAVEKTQADAELSGPTDNSLVCVRTVESTKIFDIVDGATQLPR